MTGLDARGYRLIRLVATTGGQGGLAATRLVLRYSVDGGVLWADTGAEVAIDGSAEATFWGGWAEMPDALRQSIDVQLSVWTADGNGAVQLTLSDLSVDIENLERTSAARLLPRQITPTRPAIRSAPRCAASRPPTSQGLPAPTAARVVRSPPSPKSRSPDRRRCRPTRRSTR
ncbi:MAG: hypothetical protein HWD60_00140 [Defluviicoccus sp.]|nr:MAG: hypothetical protein HWD60_00140 [Defluviicoccus sp.]